MNSNYVIVVRNKQNVLVNSTNIFCPLDEAKDFLNILMHQTGVRTGELYKKIDDAGVTVLVEEREIYHYGE